MSNNIVEVGMWFMNAFKKNESITQLKLEDDPDYRKCFLYKLSEAKVKEILLYYVSGFIYLCFVQLVCIFAFNKMFLI